MALQVTFSPAKTATIQPLQTTSLTTVTVERMVDLPDEKIVRCFLSELPGVAIVLWSGAAYDAAGQWTDSDVQARLAEAGVIS